MCRERLAQAVRALHGEGKGKPRQLAREPAQVLRLAREPHAALRLLEHAERGGHRAPRAPEVRLQEHLDGEVAELEAKLLREIDAEIHVQEAAAPMTLRTLVEDVYADVPRHLRVQYNRFVTIAERLGHAQKGDGAFPL